MWWGMEIFLRSSRSYLSFFLFFSSFPFSLFPFPFFPFPLYLKPVSSRSFLASHHLISRVVSYLYHLSFSPAFNHCRPDHVHPLSLSSPKDDDPDTRQVTPGGKMMSALVCQNHTCLIFTCCMEKVLRLIFLQANADGWLGRHIFGNSDWAQAPFRTCAF